jgi:hypothetical protein
MPARHTAAHRFMRCGSHNVLQPCRTCS